MHSPLLFLAAAPVEPGAYISIGKIIPVLLILLLWARLLAWGDKDTLRAHLPREMVNLAMLLGLVLGFALFLLLPSYAVALPVLIVIMLLEMGAYLIVRNSKV